MLFYEQNLLAVAVGAHPSQLFLVFQMKELLKVVKDLHFLFVALPNRLNSFTFAAVVLTSLDHQLLFRTGHEDSYLPIREHVTQIPP